MKIKLIITLLVFFIFGQVAGQVDYPFQDPDLSVEERIDHIISLMTLDEKIACLSTDPSVPRLGIKGSRHVEGLHGLAKGGPSNWGQIDPVNTTIFPQAIGLAESWDRDVLKRVASIEGYEVRYIFQSPKYQKGGLVVRAPNADLGRDIRWGRNEECYGEDAWFNGEMVVAFVQGLQGDHLKYWLTSSLMKHFLANSNEDDRGSSSSNFDERLWHEYYAYPFWRGVVKGGSRAYMAAYNAYNTIPCTVHPMLKEITINEWGQDGIICTDGGAYQLLVSAHKYFPDLFHAAAACLRAGINQFLDRYRDGVNEAITNQIMTEATIDSVIRGPFRVMIKLGLLDPPNMVPYTAIGVKDTLDPWLKEEHQNAAREVTRKTIVLLKNERETLPLDEEKLKSVAVIGRWANEVILDWYSGTPPYRVTALEGIRNRVGEKIRIDYSDGENVDQAVELAEQSEVAIVFVGNHPTGDAEWKKVKFDSYGKEAIDRKSIILEQESLVKAVYGANSNTIVVLISSFPYAINWTQENVPAILHMSHCSQELGNALANVLFGDYNPGGRLVQTWPKSIEHLPPMMDYNIRNGRTYMYSKYEPLYPFGYGLSYTTFEYTNLNVSEDRLKKDGEIVVQIDVSNMGQRAGDEVVQLYVQHLDSKVERPKRALRGFKRIYIQPNETKTVEIPLSGESLAYWDTTQHAFMVEEGKIKIMVGSSSANILLNTIIEVVE